MHQVLRYPFTQGRQPVQRAVHGAAQRLWRQSGRQRIDRFHLRHLAAVLGADDVVGMRHLRLALADFHAAADDAALAGGQHAADIIVAGVEEDDLQPAGLVFGDDAPRAAGAGRRLVVFDDQNLECRDAAVCHLAQRRAGAPVDQSDGKMAQKVYNMRADAFLDCRRQFGSHAGKHGGGGKQAKNFGRASGVHALCGPGRWLAKTTRKGTLRQNPDGRHQGLQLGLWSGATCCP